MKLVLDRNAFEPGEEIAGSVSHPDLIEVEVALCWDTWSRGDRDSNQVAQTQIWIERGHGRFTLTAPESPLSFTGKLLSLRYFIRARGANAEDRFDIVIGPARTVMTLASDGLDPR